MNAIRTRLDAEREAVEKIDPNAIDNPFIRRGIEYAARDDPAGAWRAVAVALAVDHSRLLKMLTEQVMLRPPPSILMCADCPNIERQ
jgi:hypothetical protein